MTGASPCLALWLLMAGAVLPACSLATPDEPLRMLWSAEDNVPESVGVPSRGAVDADHFYIRRKPAGGGIGASDLVAYNRSDGSIAWRRPIAAVCVPAIPVGDRVFCPAADLFAFDAATGRTLWTLPSDSTFEFASGTADDRRVFAGSLSSAYAVDAGTGAVLWKRSFSGDGWLGTRIRSFTLTDSGELLVALEAEFTLNAARTAAVIVAVDPATGTERWRYQDGDATTFRKVGTLTLWNGLALYSDATGQEVVAVDLSTRQVRWRVPWTRGFLGGIPAPTVVDGVAYWATGDERIYAADALTGQQVWNVKPTQGGYFNHAVCGSAVIGHNGALTVVERSSGESRGTLFSDDLVGQIAADGAELYVGTERGVYAFACD